MLLLFSGPSVDPYWDFVTTSLRFNGTNGSTSIADDTLRAWSAFNGAAVSTGSPINGSGSLLLDGANDYIATASNLDGFQFGTGDFTMEGWFSAYTDATQILFDFYANGMTAGFQVYLAGGGNNIGFYTDPSNLIDAAGPATWADGLEGNFHHFAVTRASGVLRLFMDGTLCGSVANTVNYNQSAPAFTIGRQAIDGQYPFSGLLDNIRITNGVARYTASFVPQISPPVGDTARYANVTGSAANVATSSHAVALKGTTSRAASSLAVGSHTAQVRGVTSRGAANTALGSHAVGLAGVTSRGAANTAVGVHTAMGTTGTLVYGSASNVATSSHAVALTGTTVKNEVLAVTWGGDGTDQASLGRGPVLVTDPAQRYNGQETFLYSPGSAFNVYLNGPDLPATASTQWAFSAVMRREDGLPITAMNMYMYYPASDGTAPGVVTDMGGGWYKVSRLRTGPSAAISLAGFTGFQANIRYYLAAPLMELPGPQQASNTGSGGHTAVLAGLVSGGASNGATATHSIALAGATSRAAANTATGTHAAQVRGVTSRGAANTATGTHTVSGVTDTAIYGSASNVATSSHTVAVLGVTSRAAANTALGTQTAGVTGTTSRGAANMATGTHTATGAGAASSGVTNTATGTHTATGDARAITVIANIATGLHTASMTGIGALSASNAGTGIQTIKLAGVTSRGAANTSTGVHTATGVAGASSGAANTATGVHAATGDARASTSIANLAVSTHAVKLLGETQGQASNTGTGVHTASAKASANASAGNLATGLHTVAMTGVSSRAASNLATGTHAVKLEGVGGFSVANMAQATHTAILKGIYEALLANEALGVHTVKGRISQLDADKLFVVVEYEDWVGVNGKAVWQTVRTPIQVAVFVSQSNGILGNDTESFIDMLEA